MNITYPDFIGIGAVKAATSWIYMMLQNHPKIWMPPIKELHYFDRKKNTSHLRQILSKDEDYLLSLNRWKSSSQKPSLWNIKYFCFPRNVRYYSSLFSPGKDKIRGEYTPSYALLDNVSISEIKRLVPKVKIIYILRNPVERDWSQLCMTVKNAYGLDIDELSFHQIENKYEHKFYNQSSYIRNIKRWESHFPDDQIFIGFYDQICEDPMSFLSRLFNFLEVPDSDYLVHHTLLQEKTNSYSKQMSDKVRSFLVEKEYDNIVSINTRYNNRYTNKWLKEANAFLHVS